MIVKRNEIWLANLGDREGSEQAGVRPVLIIQNDTGNLHSPTVIVASITHVKKLYLPTHVFIEAGKYRLSKDYAIMLEQIRTIDKSKLMQWKGALSEAEAVHVNKALRISLAIGE